MVTDPIDDDDGFNQWW